MKKIYLERFCSSFLWKSEEPSLATKNPPVPLSFLFFPLNTEPVYVELSAPVFFPEFPPSLLPLPLVEWPPSFALPLVAACPASFPEVA